MIDSAEIPQKPPLIDAIKIQATEVKSSLKPISIEKRIKSERAIIQMASDISEAVLVGGWALRLHMQQRGLQIPDMPALDLDYVLPKDQYLKLRGTLRFTDEELISDESFPEEKSEQIRRHFRRKGSSELVPESMGGGERNFMKSPGEYMALEDATSKQHIDVFKEGTQLDTTTLVLDGVNITVASLEELMLKRTTKLMKMLGQEGLNEHPINLARKAYQYFFLNADIIDFDKMNQLWNKRKGLSETSGTFQAEIQGLISKLTEGLATGRIKLVDQYH